MTILNDDRATITIEDVSVAENAGSATLTLKLDKEVAEEFSVNVSTSSSSADNGDYTALDSRVVTFSGSSGEQKTVNIPIINDSLVESDEVFNVSMSEVSHSSVVVDDIATVTILNDDYQLGIQYETWFCPSFPCPKSSSDILSSGILTNDIYYDWGGGNVLDSGRKDQVVVKLTGNFLMPGILGRTYTVEFRNHDDDGSLLKIDGTTIIDDWSGHHPPVYKTGSIKLVGGEVYSYERLWSEWYGGAVMRQQWKISGFHSDWKIMNGSNDFSVSSDSHRSFAMGSNSQISADACFSTCELQNKNVVIPQSESETSAISKLIPSQSRVWLGLKKSRSIWKRNGTNYAGWTDWHSNEGYTGEIRAAMVFDVSGWNGNWYDMNNDGRIHWCVCENKN